MMKKSLVLFSAACLFVGVMEGKVFAQSPAQLSAQALNRGIVNMGNTARLKQVMAKARRGEAIILGFIGGSQTVGGKATDGFCKLVEAWFKTKFPSCSITNINGGISATGSDYGCFRIQQNILQYSPDFVLMEYAVNDWGWNSYSEAYEGCIRRTLASAYHPAMMLLFLTQENGNSAQYTEQPIGNHYALPMVSFKDAILPEVAAKIINWTDVTFADRLHLNTLGHSYTAQLINHLLDKVYANLPTSDTNLPAITTMLPATKISNTFESAAYYSSGSSAIKVIANNGWSSVNWKDGGNSGMGWAASTPGCTLDIQVSGSQIGFMYYEVNNGGVVTATIDGGNAVTKDSYINSNWGYSRLGIRDDGWMFPKLADTVHTIRFTSQASSHPGSVFLLEAITAAGLTPSVAPGDGLPNVDPPNGNDSKK